jgi:L-methionine (R)-S-oxide reductase
VTLTGRQEETLEWLRERLASDASFGVICQDLVTHLKEGYAHYNWVGIYMLEGNKLRLWSWDGPAATEHAEIALGTGLCGYAASTGRLVNVADVNEDDRYLQCFLNTKSELIAPILEGDRVYGEIDIDSDTLAAFGKDDEVFLAEVCKRLSARAASEGLESRPVGKAL